MNVWKISPGSAAHLWERFKTRGEIAIGWPLMGDLRSIGFLPKKFCCHRKCYNHGIKWKLLFDDLVLSISSIQDERSFVKEFHAFVKGRGYFFSEEILARFVYSLSWKPVVILAGISGSGKTKIAQLFAEFMSKPDTQS